MRVYLIDDEIGKQEKHKEVLRIAKSRYGGKLESGFGEEPEAAKAAVQDPDRLWEALADKDGIFLIDLKWHVDSERSQLLHDALWARVEEDKKEAEAVKAIYEDLNKGVTEDLHSRRLGHLLIAICSARRRRVVCISTRVLERQMKWLRQRGLRAVGHPDGMDHDLAEAAGDVASEILGFLDIFSDLAAKTRYWFLKHKKGEHEDALHHERHCMRSGKKCLEIVRRVWPWVPPRWVRMEKENVYGSSGYCFHQSLKSLCGETAIWMPGPARVPCGQRYPLSVGAAYVLLLMAVHANDIDWINHHAHVLPDFGGLENFTARLLPWQKQIVARATIGALYNFFCKLVVRRDNGEIALGDETPVSFEEGGRRLVVPLRYEPADWEGLSVSYEGQVECCLPLPGEEGTSSSVSIDLGTTDTKTMGCWNRFLLLAQAAEDGLGMRGSVRLAGKELVVEGTMAKH